MINWIIKFYEKYTSKINVISIIIGVLGTVFGVYAYIFPINSSPKLAIVELDEAYLFINNKQIKGLKVLYDNKDLNQEGTNLIVKRIKITNLGKSPVRLDDYANDDIKLKFHNCKLISVDLEKTQNNPITTELIPQIVDSNTLHLNKVVFNPGEKVIFNVYILHNSASKSFGFNTIGRIAGQGNIFKTTYKDLENDTTIFEDIYTIIIALLPVIGVIGGFIALIYVKDFLESYIRKKIILRKFNYKIKELSPAQNIFVDTYVRFGKDRLINLLKCLLKGAEYIKQEEEMIKALELVGTIEYKHDKPYNYSEYFLTENKFKSKGLIVKNSHGDYEITKELEVEVLQTLELFKNK